MVANIQSAIAKLKHKDVRQRRRVVRILFDADAYESVEAFSPLLEDKDIWFRNKAIEAYRRWALKHNSPSRTTRSRRPTRWTAMCCERP